jgi:hypothetical protein
MTGDMRILTAQRVEAALSPYRFALDLDQADRVDAYWREKTQANPSLYDGPVLLAHEIDATPNRLSLRFFETRFSRFMYLRDYGFPDPRAYNCFSMAALRSCDGAFLLGEMCRGHSSEGKIYFPAGTPDPSDVRGQEVDLFGSLVRELKEETGIDATEGVIAPDWTIVFESGRVACMKIIDHPQPAAAILARVRGFLAQEAQPELSGAVMISRRDQLDDPRMPLFMQVFLARELP